MRVLKKGTGQKGWSKKVTCTGAGNGDGGCGAELLVEQPDLYETYNCDYTGDCDHFVTFTCAECGVETDIKDVPSNIRSKLPSKKAFFGENDA
jgi:hypothetical protein